jgi:putative glutathione S-transferase
MGMLINGRWDSDAAGTQASDGSFVRAASPFRDVISNPSSDSKQFPAEKGRYNIVVSYACPWAHRTLLYRALLDLEEVIDISVVNPISYPKGWTFQPYKGVSNLTGLEIDYVHELYTAIDPHFTGKVTVPTLWDKKTKRIVNNESSEIIRMLDGPFSQLLGNSPNSMLKNYSQTEIESMNALIYKGLNNGVYRVGFAKSQSAYNASVALLFETLDKLDTVLARNTFLLGSQPCECDWRLLPTLVRFDQVYYYHFKCNKQKLRSYKNIRRYMHRLLEVPKVAETLRLDHIIDHYYLSHLKINPYATIPIGVSNDIADL